MSIESSILQFRIELLGVQPLIWRRIQVPGGYTFWDLHVAIQSAFAWNDSHLHEFRLTTSSGKRLCFGLPVDGDYDRGPDGELLPVWKHKVADYLNAKSDRIAYLYDFGDAWEQPSSSKTRCPRRLARSTLAALLASAAGRRTIVADLPVTRACWRFLPTHWTRNTSHRMSGQRV